MRSRRTRMSSVLPLVSLLFVSLLLPAAARAQDGFLFRPPTASVALRFGHARPAVSGELFESLRRMMTMSEGDFGTEAIAAELMIAAADRLDVGVGLEWSQSRVESEYRDLVYPDDSPIEQVTRLRRIPLQVSARFYPLPRGKALSQHVWLPARVTPFLGGGGGLLWYKLVQHGNFVDYQTYDIFVDRYETSGVTIAGHVLGGLSYWLSPRVGLTGEGRYTWSSSSPDGGQFNFDSMDLEGWQVTAGVAFRF